MPPLLLQPTERHLRVMRELVAEGRALKATDLKKRTGLSTAEVHSMCKWLRANDYITVGFKTEKNPLGQKIRVSFWKSTDKAVAYLSEIDALKRPDEQGRSQKPY